MFNWISAFRKLPDKFVLNTQSLDNFLFIRYFQMLSLICLVGTIITWPVLLWVNSKGGGGGSELDKFTFSNVSDPNQYYWHAACAWIFLGEWFTFCDLNYGCLDSLMLTFRSLCHVHYRKRDHLLY